MRTVLILVLAAILGAAVGLLAPAPTRASHAYLKFQPPAGHPLDHDVAHTCRWHSVCDPFPPPPGTALDWDTDHDGWFDHYNFFRAYGYGSQTAFYVTLYDASGTCTEARGRVYYSEDEFFTDVGTMRYVHVTSWWDGDFFSLSFSSTGTLNDIFDGFFVDPEKSGCPWSAAHVHEDHTLLLGDVGSFSRNTTRWSVERWWIDPYVESNWTRKLTWW